MSLPELSWKAINLIGSFSLGLAYLWWFDMENLKLCSLFWNMADSCATSCICWKEFKTRVALRKLGLLCEASRLYCTRQFKFQKERQRSFISNIAKGLKRKYLTWMSEITESINSAHNPLVPGKFYRIASLFVRYQKLRQNKLFSQHQVKGIDYFL